MANGSLNRNSLCSGHPGCFTGPKEIVNSPSYGSGRLLLTPVARGDVRPPLEGAIERAQQALLGARRWGERIAICVVDTGIGIPADRRADVFEDFLQLGNPERNRARGFGLGLGIVRRLCEGMGWGVELRSEVGRGSVFTILVPCARATPAPR